MKRISLIFIAGSLAVAAQAQLIDDFNTPGLSEYTQTVVLQNGASSGIVFSDSTGALTLSKASGTSPEQVLFLRNDFSLSVGQTLRVDTISQISDGTVTDFGLAISALVNPPAAVWTGANVSTRQDYINVYLKRQTGAIGYIGFNGTTQQFSSSGVTPVPDFASVTGLFITRTASDSFDLGYSTASGDTSLFSATGMPTTIGNALGFYADVRSVTSYGTLDNLRLTAVPEPASATLLALGGISALVLVFRRRAASVR